MFIISFSSYTLWTQLLEFLEFPIMFDAVWLDHITGFGL